jgi:NAD dependent epimerase/dehydratase family enzyme
VLGKNGGALKPLVSLTKFGLGGKQASGKQKFSWVHIEDYFRILLFLVEYPTLSGIINGTSPYPISNKSFMNAIRQTLHVPIGIPAPKIAIRLGAKLIGTEPSLLLDSSYIVPKRLLGAGFHFTFSKLKKALSDILE